MKDLKQIMDKKEDTVVYFYKTDCISCKKLARKLQDNNLKKYNVKGIDLSEPENVDENFLTKYDIVTVPTFFKIVDGKMTEKTDGIKELKDFKQFMESDE
nr:thioredoxin family protein [Enterococcus sp. DIV0212c]